MRFFVVSLFLTLALLVHTNEAYRILCLFPFNGKSHFIMFDALCKGLAKKGHRVDMISHFPTKNPPANYVDIIDLSGTKENIVSNFTVEYARNLDTWLTYYIATTFGYEICELMGHEKMQNFIKNPPNDPPYDIIITEFFGASCYIGFGQFLRAPIAVAMSSMDTSYLQEILGNPLNNAFFAGLYTKRVVGRSFWDRLTNTLRNFVQSRIFFYYTSTQTEIMRKYLGQDLPDIREIEKNISLALINSHYSFYGIRATTPALVQVGGLHIEEDETELTTELQAWMNEAKDGVVYFTLGSLVNIETMSENKILGMYASFKKIAPVRVLMKCANKTKLPPGLPSNVLTLPWIPQIPVLRHKNTRVFITHGGLMGSQEALHYGIPMIGIPMFADQILNVDIFVHKNMGVLLHFDHIAENTMDAALNAVLNDPTYMRSAKRESAKFKDRPVKPMDLAIHSIEYIIKHGSTALKSPAVDLPWWQLYLIDVFVFLIACTVAVLSLLVFLIRIFVRKLYSLHRVSGGNKKKRS